MKLCDKESLRKVLSNAIPLLCQSGLPKQTTFRIDAMIGITIDDHEASTLICFSEHIGPNKQPNIMSLEHNNLGIDSNADCNNLDYQGTFNEEFGEHTPSNEDLSLNDVSNNYSAEEAKNTENASLHNSDSDARLSNSNNIELPYNNMLSNNIRKRPRKSKPYSNSQLIAYQCTEEGAQSVDNTVIKQEVDEKDVNDELLCHDPTNINNNNNNNNNNNTDWPENKQNDYTNIVNDQFNNSNNNPIEDNTDKKNCNMVEESKLTSMEEVWGDNVTPQQTGKKVVRNRKANRKYADALSDSLPLQEASAYLEQQQNSSTAAMSTSLAAGDLLGGINSNDTDYNHLMQGICDFVMSQSQHIDDKTRPQSRTCHICQATLSNPLSLKNHIQGTHLALKLRRCNLCGETFKWTMQLARHKKRVHGGGDYINLYNVT